jgi:rod shape-determining protein MreC
MASYTEPPEEGRGRRDLPVVVGLILLSIVALYLPAGTQARIAQGFQDTILRPFTLVREALAQARLRAEDALELQARLDSLGAAVATQATLAEENRRLREMLDLEARAPETFIHANLFRPGTVGSASMFLLDVGTDEGVQVGDPVLMRAGRVGLLGVIREVNRDLSIGLDWSHPEFAATAMTADASVFGLVEPRAGDFRGGDRLLLTAIPYNEQLAPGTLITTSGLGGVFPRGIPIGEVMELHQNEGQWQSEYWLEPVVLPGSVNHVLIARSDSSLIQLFQTLREQAGDSIGVGPEGGQGG